MYPRTDEENQDTLFFFKDCFKQSTFFAAPTRTSVVGRRNLMVFLKAVATTVATELVTTKTDFGYVGLNAMSTQ